MKLLRKLPGTRREPPGLEWTVLRKLPIVLLVGTLIPAVWTLAARYFITGASALEVAKQVQLNDYLAIGFVVFFWTVVLTVALFCVIVLLMKGPAYVADSYELPDSKYPKE